MTGSAPSAPTSRSVAPVIRLEGVTRTFGEGEVAVHALRDVTLAVARGEFVVLLGPSGSGKTTLLNLVAAIDSPSQGTVEVAGTNLSFLDARARTAFRRDHVGFVFQFFNLIPTLTGLENVRVIAELTGHDASQAEELLAEVDLAGRSDRFPSGLSGGEQQRVAVARALVKQPDVLLCDEPTGALDLDTGRQVLMLLRRLNLERGATVVLVTHNSAIAAIADRVVSLRDGTVAEDCRNAEPLDPALVTW